MAPQSVLLVKTSSLGDLIHALPAVSDARATGAVQHLDWVVEEGFAALPALHPGVDAVFPCALRRWRRAPWSAAARAEMHAFARGLRGREYEAVVDAQGLFKSALITRLARGPRHGKDWTSAREPLALFYDQTYEVPWSLHAVERNRLLMARALGYAVEGAPDYGLSGVRPAAADAPYAVLLHATSADSKLWPEPAWLEFGAQLAQRGLRCVLPWGNPREQQRAQRLAAAMPAAQVTPPLELAALAALLKGARAVAGVDTGLTHLAAALGVPTLGIYTATDPAATGLYGGARAANLGGLGAPPTAAQALQALDALMEQA